MTTDDAVLFVTFCEGFTEFLREDLTSGRKINKSHITIAFSELSQSMSEGLDRDDRTSSTSVRPIIYSSCVSHRPISKIMKCILKEPLFLGSFHNTAIEIWSHALRKEREYMDVHRLSEVEDFYFEVESFSYERVGAWVRKGDVYCLTRE